jgi:hypothetical protein
MIGNRCETGPADINAIVGIVSREAREECSEYACQIFPILDECVAWAVKSHWQGRVKRFVPLLALPSVRECIRVGECQHVPSSREGLRLQ